MTEQNKDMPWLPPEDEAMHRFVVFMSTAMLVVGGIAAVFAVVAFAVIIAGATGLTHS